MPQRTAEIRRLSYKSNPVLFKQYWADLNKSRRERNFLYRRLQGSSRAQIYGGPFKWCCEPRSMRQFYSFILKHGAFIRSITKYDVYVLRREVFNKHFLEIAKFWSCLEAGSSPTILIDKNEVARMGLTPRQ